MERNVEVAFVDRKYLPKRNDGITDSHKKKTSYTNISKTRTMTGTSKNSYSKNFTDDKQKHALVD